MFFLLSCFCVVGLQIFHFKSLYIRLVCVFADVKAQGHSYITDQLFVINTITTVQTGSLFRLSDLLTQHTALFFYLPKCEFFLTIH